MAFRQAGRIGISDRLAAGAAGAARTDPSGRDRLPDRRDRQDQCHHVGTSRAILGFDTREGWAGWDVVKAMMPETEIGDLIIEIARATSGAGRSRPSSTICGTDRANRHQIVAARKAEPRPRHSRPPVAQA